MRDAGWIQLYCADNQEAVDTTIQAFRIAERTELPVMVCMDGYVLTHTLEPIDLPDAGAGGCVSAAAITSRARSTPLKPISIGNLVTPEYYTEARYTHHRALLRARGRDHRGGSRLAKVTRPNVAADCCRWTGPKAREVAILSIGSVMGTLADARDQFRNSGR